MMCSIILILALTGCTHGLGRVNTREIAKLTNAKYHHVEKDEEEPRSTYHFQGEYFDFTVSEYYTTPTFAPLYTRHTSYYEALYLWKMPEMQTICEKYGYTLQNNLETTWPYHAREKAMQYGTYVIIEDFSETGSENWHSKTNFHFYTTDVEAQDVEDCAKEILEILSPYLLTNPTETFIKEYVVYHHVVTQQDNKLSHTTTTILDGHLYFENK